ncbi:DUF1648 domain-containing protein [Streptomyces sp. NPDC059002]|uniref:DUF1648 domain-containing protein n=1 Tax=Streptomyces sp. NPDC059002 TaxID=3346690 RepID=UPI0036CA6120
MSDVDGRANSSARAAAGVLAVLPFALAFLVELVAYVMLRDRLPDRIASHFGADGAADGYAGRGSYLVVNAGLFVGLGAVAGYVALKSGYSRYRRGLAGVLACCWATAGFLGWPMTASLFANRDVADGAAVRFPLWQLAVAVGVAVVAAGVGAALGQGLGRRAALPMVRPVPGAQGDGGVARLGLADAEVAGWVCRTGSWWLWGLGVALAVAGIVVAWLQRDWLTPLSLLVPGLLVAGFARPCVAVDRRGLTVSPGALPWPRVRLPLDRMERADSDSVNALADYGGWGYRIRPGGSGIILRSGEALVVRRANGKSFAVTVEDSGTAAALLNTLVERRAEGR